MISRTLKHDLLVLSMASNVAFFGLYYWVGTLIVQRGTQVASSTISFGPLTFWRLDVGPLGDGRSGYYASSSWDYGAMLIAAFGVGCGCAVLSRTIQVAIACLRRST